jgi:hypothetical protein
MSKLSLIKRNKNNHFRKKSTLRRRNTRRKYSSKKSKSKNGGGSGASRFQEYRLKPWNPKIFFKTKHNDKMHCTTLVTTDRGWQSIMYNTLIHFFDNFPDILQKPANIDIIKTTYLDFYEDKKDWLVKQYCISTNATDISKYSIKPPKQDSEMISLRMNHDVVSFLSWLTNLEYKDADENIRQNEFWRNITAPNPDEYDSPASSSDSSGGVKDPLLASSAYFR